jgi:hypothetical protein
MEMNIMNLDKLQAAYRRASQLAADLDVEPYQRECFQQIARSIWEGAGLSAPANAEWQEVVEHYCAERLILHRGRATLQCFIFGIDRWESHESDELPIDPDRLRRWLQGWSEQSIVEACVLLQAPPLKRAA